MERQEEGPGHSLGLSLSADALPPHPWILGAVLYPWIAPLVCFSWYELISTTRYWSPSQSTQRPCLCQVLLRHFTPSFHLAALQIYQVGICRLPFHR